MRYILTRCLMSAVVLLLALPDISAAQRRNRDAGDSDSGSQAVPRESAPAPAPAPSAPPPAPAGAPDSGPAVTRTSPRSGSSSGSSASSSEGARPREGRAAIGRAVPRGSVPSPRPNNPNVVVPPYYGSYWPWGFGGLGFGSYYGGRYGSFYDPYYPWYGGYVDPGAYGYPSSAYRYGPEGSLRLKIKPRDAQVFVDGYYVGLVDDFDGVFQRLNVEVGPHRIEVRAPGFEPLTFDVRVRFDDTTNLEGELRRLP